MVDSHKLSEMMPESKALLAMKQELTHKMKCMGLKHEEIVILGTLALVSPGEFKTLFSLRFKCDSNVRDLT